MGSTQSPEPTESAGPTELAVQWTVPFSLTAPAGWTTDVPGAVALNSGEGVWLATPPGRYLAVTRSGPDTVDEWVESVMTAEQLVATDPMVAEIGGAAGYRVDLRTSDAAAEGGCLSNTRCYRLFQDASGYWPVEEGRVTRAWIVDVDGETLVITTDASEEGFEEWAASVEEVLGTLTWTD